MDKKFRFCNFPLYKDARELRKKIKVLSKKFPREEKYCLQNQLWRSLDSIILNIAEGSDRGTDKDFAHFLNTAHTSLNEVVGCLDLALDDNYIIKEEYENYLIECGKLADQLTAFRRKLLNEPNK